MTRPLPIQDNISVTIAMCYVLHEGVVFGADSTTSNQSSGFHYFNHNQKLL